MKKELRIFFTALMFLTRLHVPRLTDHSPEYLKKSTRYFSLVGWIVGGIGALVFYVFSLFLSLELSLLASMIATVLATGAFHEDGFADVCDAFGGGWTKEKILVIMKDSRLGTYGTIGLIFILAAKYATLHDLAVMEAIQSASYLLFLKIIWTAHAFSRFMSVVSIQYFPYVTDDAVSKSKPSAAQKLSRLSFLLCFLFAVVPFAFLPLSSLLVIPWCLLATVLLNLYFKKWVGGHTGDCLGTVQQTTEVLFYLLMLVIWKFI